MGRKLSDHSVSPIRDRGGLSPHRRGGSRKSPARRERSPVRNRGMNRDSSPSGEKHSGHGNSLKHAESRSPGSRSPSPRTRRLMRGRNERKKVEKVTERNHDWINDKEMNREKPHSPAGGSSPRSRRLMRKPDERVSEKVIERESERNRSKGSDKGVRRERSHTPISRSPSPRTKRLRRAQAEKNRNKEVEKEHERNHDKGKDARRPTSRSPSPRTRRLRRSQGDTELTERENEKYQSKGSIKGTNREKGSDREPGSEQKEKLQNRDIEDERKDKRLGREDVNRKSSKTRHERSASPLDQRGKSRPRSYSPRSADGARARHEVSGDIHSLLLFFH